MIEAYELLEPAPGQNEARSTFFILKVYSAFRSFNKIAHAGVSRRMAKILTEIKGSIHLKVFDC